MPTCLLHPVFVKYFLKLRHFMPLSLPLTEIRPDASKLIFLIRKDKMALLAAKISFRLESKVLIHLILIHPTEVLQQLIQNGR